MNIFLRIIIAVIAVAFAYALIPLVCKAVGWNPSSAIIQTARLCTAAIAIFYIIGGPAITAFWRRTP